MGKKIKILIVLVLFGGVIFYLSSKFFVEKPVVNICSNFNQILMSGAEEYFKDKLPTEPGEVKVVAIKELVESDVISTEDIKEMGSDLSGDVYVSKGENGDYYYSTDVTCGNCDTSSLYTEWSNWVEKLPETMPEDSQIQTNMFYNYGKSESVTTDWSDWGLDEQKLSESQIPSGAILSNTEKEEKTQYSYRDGSFKWYKLAGGIEYYNNGEYLETSPGTGWTKYLSSKKISRTVLNENKIILESLVSGIDSNPITTITGHVNRVPKYTYSYRSPEGCYSYKHYVNCYKYNYGNKACYTTSKSVATANCIAGSTLRNCIIRTCNGSPVTYGYSYTEKFYLSVRYIEGKCPIGYVEEMTSATSIECQENAVIYKTYYLKADGTKTTNKSEAAYLNSSEYLALHNLNPEVNYIINLHDVKYDDMGSYIEGGCPSDTKGTTCEEATIYKTTTYKYKWYKTSSSVKEWYNNSKYLSESPGNEYQPDIANAKWGEWSEFSDNAVLETLTKQVKTQSLKRVRNSYIGVKNSYLENFLPLDEFETRVGKTLTELSSDETITIQEKPMYRYRILK